MIEGSNGVASKIDENKVVPESIEGPDEKSTVDSNVFKDIGFKPKFSYFSGSHRTINLRWSELSLSIGDKSILKNINGHVSSGSVSALMGPSGSGKSSLLNVLAGRVLPSRRTKISGDILVNDRKIKSVQFRQNLAYVMQEDLLYATATAREAIEFSAHLRLPKVISRNPAKIKQIVDDLLDSLGLSHVHDTMVGSEKLRGLSGGEKKRVAIGVELVTNPSLLFLDEPTSGLDSFSAWKVVKILKALGSATGCAIVCSIHQPNSEIFQSFDSVTVLSEGRVMYGGTVKQMPQILKGLGKPIPEMTNPADFILLLAQTSSDSNLISYNVDKSIIESPGAVSDELVKDEDKTNNSKTVGSFVQTLYLARREIINIKRDYISILIGAIISFFLNMLFGLIFYNVGDRNDPDFELRNVFGAMVMIISCAMFASVEEPLVQLPLDRGIFLREYRTGTYASSPYLFSKLLVEIPRSLVNPAFSWIGAYFFTGFQGNIFIFILIGWALALSVASYAVLLGSAVDSPESAQALAPLLFVPQLLFSGLFVPLEVIPSWVSWAQYLCVMKYAINLALIEELGECEFKPNEVDLLPLLESNCTQLYELNDIDPELWWRDVLFLVAVFFGFRTLSVLILKVKAENYA